MAHRLSLWPSNRRIGAGRPWTRQRPVASGNYQHQLGDYWSVDCEACREALSARLDGEDQPAERAEVTDHLGRCAGCRAWYDSAVAITRLARTTAVPAPKGVSDTVLEAAPGPGRARTASVLRWVLGGLSAAQLLLGVSQVAALAGHAYVDDGQMASPSHLWHESAAWNLAVGTGFAWIALRRARPSGMTPTLTVFVAILALLSLGDVTAGRVRAVWLLSHGFVLAGYAIIMLLAHPVFDFGTPPSQAQAGRRRRPLFRGRSHSKPPAHGPSTRHEHVSGPPAAQQRRAA